MKSDSSCYFCGDQENVHEHHIIPKRLNPPEEIQDTETICGSCHTKLHNRFLNRLINYTTPNLLWNYYKQIMLELGAEYEVDNRPYVYSSQGFDKRGLKKYLEEVTSVTQLRLEQDIWISEFVLRKLESDGLFERVGVDMDINGSYRMTSVAWGNVKIDEPDVPVEADFDEMGCPICRAPLHEMEESDEYDSYICDCGWEGHPTTAEYIGDR